MPINLECDCGKTFKVLDDLAGKRVKCPGCKEILAVPGGAARAATVAREVDDTADEIDDDPDDRQPRRNPFKKKKKKQAKSRSRLGLWIALAGGVVVLGFCCVGLGVGGFFLFLRNTPEKTMIGRWQVDFPAQQKNDPNPLFNNLNAAQTTMEFRADGTLVAADFGLPTVTRQWKHVKTDGEVVTMDISGGGFPNTVRANVTVIDSNHIRFQSSTLGASSIYLKRMGS
jgi:hypothetical protein